MPLLRITNGFERLSEPDLIIQMRHILDGIKDNPNFVSPVPSLSVFQDAITAFVNAVAAGNGTVASAIKRDRRQELIDRAHSLSNYVLFIADGNELIARSSHFTIAKPYGSSAALVNPTGLRLRDGGNAGELIFTFDKVHGAKSYIYQYTLDPYGNEWTSRTGTTTKFFVKGLTSCKKYWFRVVAIGIKGQEVISDVVGRVVQ